jgi:hypothetical protein
VVRDPAVSKAEWDNFLSTRADFEVLSEAVGASTDGKSIDLGHGMVFWTAHSSGIPLPVAWAPDCIHFLDSDDEVAEFAQSIAAHFRGSVQDW